MIIGGSQLIAALAGVLKATPQSGDTDVTVPPVLMPVAILPEPTTYGLSQGTGAGLTLVEQTTSFVVGYNGARTAGGGLVTDRVMKLGQGLWRVDVSYSAVMAAAAESCILEVSMGTPSGSGGGGGRILDLSVPGAIVAISGRFSGVISVPIGHSFLMNALLNNTSGATTIRVTVGGFASKLG